MNYDRYYITLSFWDEAIRFHKKTLTAMNKPDFIHLLINTKKKQLYIRSCNKDNDAFRIRYEEYDDPDWNYKITAKALLKYLARVIGVPFPSESLVFSCSLQDDGRMLSINLKEYQIIPHKEEKEG